MVGGNQPGATSKPLSWGETGRTRTTLTDSPPAPAAKYVALVGLRGQGPSRAAQGPGQAPARTTARRRPRGSQSPDPRRLATPAEKVTEYLNPAPHLICPSLFYGAAHARCLGRSRRRLVAHSPAGTTTSVQVEECRKRALGEGAVWFSVACRA